jgi:hypothetical protein
MWIQAAADHTADARIKDRLGAGTGPALEVAGLERDGDRRATKRRRAMPSTDGLDRNDFRMRPTDRPRRAATEDPIAPEHDGTHAGVRMGSAIATGR